MSSSSLTTRDILNLIGDKWSVLVISLLGEGPHRFGELRRSIDGISQRMLTRTLRALERAGLLTRTVLPTVPPQVQYALTPLGKTLLGPVRALTAWVEAHRVELQAARDAFDRTEASASATPHARERKASS